LRVLYGIATQEELDDYVRIAYLASESLIVAANHGSFFVDYLPWLKYVPAWLPGASFKQKANAWAPMVSDLLNTPWETLKSSMVKIALSGLILYTIKHFIHFFRQLGQHSLALQQKIWRNSI
ncbi:hypothetical protein K435DRAFT_671855, partial [Dendrothele bispora CBS 962.96]